MAHPKNGKIAKNVRNSDGNTPLAKEMGKNILGEKSRLVSGRKVIYFAHCITKHNNNNIGISSVNLSRKSGAGTSGIYTIDLSPFTHCENILPKKDR